MATGWTECKRVILQHLRTGTGAAFVGEGEHGVVMKRPAILMADVDSGEAARAVLGPADYANTLYFKVLADNDEKRETLMRQIRQCWEKTTTAGRTRVEQLVRAGVLNIYPEGHGEKSLFTQEPTTPQTYEGLLAFRVWYRETT